MISVFPKSKFKIIALLAIFVLLTISLVNKRFDFNPNRIKTIERESNSIFIQSFNNNPLNEITKSYTTLEDQANISHSTIQPLNANFPKIFCMILTHPKNFKTKVKHKLKFYYKEL